MARIDRFMSAPKAAAMLGITLEQLRNLKDGPKPIYKLGSRYYEIRAVKMYLGQQRAALLKSMEQQPNNLLEVLMAGP